MFTVEVPGYEGRAYEIKKGQYLRITDVEGTQIADWIAFNADDLTEKLSGSETLNLEWRTRVKIGSRFWSSKQRPMFEVISDDANGVHDMTHAPCSKTMYRLVLGTEDHPNCRDNLLGAVTKYGIKDHTLPDTINLFQNTPMAPDGSTASGPGVTKSGDAIVVKALMDCVGAVSACSVDYEPAEVAINGPKSTPILIEVLEESEMDND